MTAPSEVVFAIARMSSFGSNMGDEAVRLLRIAARELGASSVRLELPDEPSEHDTELACTLQGHWRLVARFESAPDDVEAKRTALQTFVESFRELLHGAVDQAPVPTKASGNARLQELTDLLEVLRERLNACCVFIIDEQSPVLWAAAPPLPWLSDVNAAIDEVSRRGVIPMRTSGAPEPLSSSQVAGAESTSHEQPDPRLRELVERALLAARGDRFGGWDHDETGGFCIKSFAGIYRLAALFDGPCSELACEATLRRALPVIERHVSSLPPRDPEPNDRNVRSLHKRP